MSWKNEPWLGVAMAVSGLFHKQHSKSRSCPKLSLFICKTTVIKDLALLLALPHHTVWCDWAGNIGVPGTLSDRKLVWLELQAFAGRACSS
jgi:hypothetical protein